MSYCFILISIALLFHTFQLHQMSEEIFDLKAELQFHEWLEDKINEERQIQK